MCSSLSAVIMYCFDVERDLAAITAVRRETWPSKSLPSSRSGAESVADVVEEGIMYE